MRVGQRFDKEHDHDGRPWFITPVPLLPCEAFQNSKPSTVTQNSGTFRAIHRSLDDISYREPRLAGGYTTRGRVQDKTAVGAVCP